MSLTVRFPETILIGLREASEEEERALNTVIVRACRTYLEADPEEGAKKKGR